jgi:hypothetical protein
MLLSLKRIKKIKKAYSKIQGTDHSNFEPEAVVFPFGQESRVFVPGLSFW